MALFWLSDEAWAAIEPHLPKNQPGARRVDNRRVISDIMHVLKLGCHWCASRPITGRRRRSTTGLIAGRTVASGSGRSTRLWMLAWSRRLPRSTAPTPRMNIADAI